MTNYQKPKILYIAGDGRSGSTFLSIVLDNHADIVSGGELSFLLDDWENAKRVCSCGERYTACPSWQELFSSQKPSSHDQAVIRKVERLPNWPTLLMGRVSQADRRRYCDIHDDLFKHIATVSGASIVVDASKSARAAAGRAAALHTLADFDVYVLHLVRDGVATMESALLKGSNWQIEGYIDRLRWPAPRAAIGWVLSNLSATIAGWVVGRKRYLRMHYDDLVREPDIQLRKIGEFCGFDATPLIQRIHTERGYQVGHMAGGNRVRFQREVRFRSDGLREKETRLSRTQLLLFQIIGGCLNWFYHSASSKSSA